VPSKQELRESRISIGTKTIPTASGIEGKKELKFISASGCYGIKASAHLLMMDGHHLLLDAGYSEKNSISIDLITSRQPEAVFITHAHLDHIGSLPLIHRKIPSIPIYMTPATKTLAYTILDDSRNVASLKGNELFTREEIDATLESVVTVDFDQEFDFKDLKVVFRCAGHILGAAYIIIEGSNKILYTGDISTLEFLTTPSAYIPPSKETVDLLICESTYGDFSNVTSRETEVANFCSEVSNVIERGGRVLIPSFAMGRAQEVLTILLNEMNKGNLQKIQVVLDGMARTITERYDDYSDCMPSNIYRECRRSNFLRPVGDSQNRERIAGDNTPCVIIASSGMLTGGPSVAYAKKILDEEKSAILIVGYVDEEAPGRKIADSKLNDQIELTSEDGTKEAVKRRCEVREYRLSAHSNQQELVRFSLVYEPGAIFLVHGEEKAKVYLAKALLRSNLSPVFIPENEEEIDVDQLLRLWTAIKIAETGKKQKKEDLNVVYERIVDDLHDKGRTITLEDLTQSIENAHLLRYCGSPKQVRKIMYDLFGWSLKYSKGTQGLDFEFSAQILQKGALFIQSLYGKGFGQRFLWGLERTLLAMFKNFVFFGGPHVTRKGFQVNIESESQLVFSLENFEFQFQNLNIHGPKFGDIKRLCAGYAQETPLVKEKYSAVFESPTAVHVEKVKKKLGIDGVEEGEKRETAILKATKKSQHLKKSERSNISVPIVPEGLIGLGEKYGPSNVKKGQEERKKVMEFRDVFLATDKTCVFCGSKKLELLKVSNPDPKTCRLEYKCPECKLVFALISPNL
jgi:Cft2 family RNA processing exonuclease